MTTVSAHVGSCLSFFTHLRRTHSNFWLFSSACLAGYPTKGVQFFSGVVFHVTHKCDNHSERAQGIFYFFLVGAAVVPGTAWYCCCCYRCSHITLRNTREFQRQKTNEVIKCCHRTKNDNSLPVQLINSKPSNNLRTSLS